jgi:hypothetical protein
MTKRFGQKRMIKWDGQWISQGMDERTSGVHSIEWIHESSLLRSSMTEMQLQPSKWPLSSSTFFG